MNHRGYDPLEFVNTVTKTMRQTQLEHLPDLVEALKSGDSNQVDVVTRRISEASKSSIEAYAASKRLRAVFISFETEVVTSNQTPE